MNIFVTVGFESFPFDRLIKFIDEAVAREFSGARLMIQTGNSKYIPRFCPSQQFLRFDEVVNYINLADIVVSHAGVGTTLLALKAGKIPILFPRRAEYGEHIDNHQLDFARKMEELKKVLVAYEPSELLIKIRKYGCLVKELLSDFGGQASGSLKEYLQQYLEEIARRQERLKNL